jgi:TP901 family phage tail tape measure protein
MTLGLTGLEESSSTRREAGQRMATLPIIVDAARARSGAAQASTAIGKVRKEADAATRSTRKLNKGLRQTGAASKLATGQLSTLVGGFTAFVAVRAAIKAIANFEEQMAVLRGVTQIPSELDSRFKALEETARQLGATTRFTASEAAEGLTFLARAGFSAEESMDAVASTLNLASVGMLQLGQAADFASNIVSQFSLAAAETERVVDTLINTANSSNTSVLQLSEAMKFAGAISGSLGNSVEETAAAIGALGNRGIQASLAGTNLRGVLASLLAPSEGAGDALRRLNISLRDIDPSVRSINQIFEVFRDRGLDAQAAVELFGKRNAAAALILRDSTETMNELTEANKAAAGTAAAQAEIVENTLAGAFRTLKAAVEDLFLTTGDKGLAGALKDVVQTLTGAIRIIAGAEPNVGALNDAAETLADTMKGLALTFAAITTIKIVGFLTSVGTAIGLLTMKVFAFTAALLSNPIFAAAAGAFAVGYVVTTALIEAFAEETEEATEAIKEEERVLTDLSAALKGVADSQERFNETVKEGVAGQEAGFGAIASQVQAFKALQETIRATTEAGQRFEVPAEFTFGLRGRRRPEDEIPEEQRTAELRVMIEQQSGDRALAFFDKLQRETEDLEALLETVRRRFQEEEQAAAAAAAAREREIEAAAAIIKETNAIEDEIDALELERKVLEESEAFRNRSKLSAELLGKTFGELTLNQQELVGELENSQKALEDLADAQDELARKDSLAKNIEGFVQSLKDEVGLLEREKDEREKIVAIRELEALAAKEGFDLTEVNLTREIDQVKELIDRKQALVAAEEARTKALQEQAEAERQLREEGERALETFNENVDTIGREIEMVGISGQEREKRNALLAAEADLNRAVAAGLLTQQQAEEKLAQFREDVDELQRLESIQMLADDMAASFTDAFGAFLTGEASAQEALEGLVLSLQRAIVEALILRPLMDAIAGSAGGGTGLGGALAGLFGKGAVFNGGNVIPFQRGEIFGAPTVRRLGGGRTGLLGESGPEAALPLARLSSGRLGVETSGGGGGVSIGKVEINGAQDFDSFRRSTRQLKTRLVRAVGRTPGGG